MGREDTPFLPRLSRTCAPSLGMGTLFAQFPMAFAEDSAQAVFQHAVRGPGGLCMPDVEKWAQVCRASLLWWRARIRAAEHEDIGYLLVHIPFQCRRTVLKDHVTLVPGLGYVLPPDGGLLVWSDLFNPLPSLYRIAELVSWNLGNGLVSAKSLVAYSNTHERACVDSGFEDPSFVRIFRRWDDVVRWALRPRDPPPLEEAGERPAKRQRLLY